MEERRRLDDLTNRKRELQRQHYLEQHDIDQAKIRGIGISRTLTLKSYGIETAADVNYKRIVTISGFGPGTANSLLAWRQQVESAFHFDPKQAINPADITAIKVDIATKRADLENRARQTINKLQKAASDAVAIRANPGSQAIDAWTEWRNAQEVEKELRPSAREAVQLFAAGTVCVVSLIGYADLKFSPPPNLFEKQEQSKLTSSTLPREPQPPVSSGGSVTPQPGNPPSPQPAPNSTTSQPEEPARPLQTLPSTAVPAAPTKQTPLDLGTVAGVDIPSTGKDTPGSLNLLDRSNATRVQERLRFLGYFSDQPDGIWGSHSRAALRNFRHTKGLGGDDRWDAGTQMALMADDAPRAESGPMAGPVQADTDYPAPPGALHNPLNRPDALWLQGRLRQLGYYFGNSDGVWGLSSRTALQAFKAQNGLPADDTWDVATESKLLALGGAAIVQPFEGGWAQHIGDCGTGSSGAPIKISQNGAQANGGNCDFEDVRRDGMGWRVRGLCRAGGKSWEADIHLSLVGGALIWSSERGTVTYFRCR